MIYKLDVKKFIIKLKCLFGFHEPKSTFGVDAVTRIATSNCKYCDKDFKLI